MNFRETFFGSLQIYIKKNYINPDSTHKILLNR